MLRALRDVRQSRSDRGRIERILRRSMHRSAEEAIVEGLSRSRVVVEEVRECADL
jgi:hypothetical protein